MIEITTNKNGQFYFRVKAINGAVLCESGNYESKQGVKSGVESLLRELNKKKLSDIVWKLDN